MRLRAPYIIFSIGTGMVVGAIIAALRAAN